MLRLFRKSLKTGTVTTDYPQTPSVPGTGFQGLPVWQVQSCVQCGQCADICPTKAIKLQSGKKEAFWIVDPKKCIFCGYCVEVCTRAIVQGEQYEFVESVDRAPQVQAFKHSVHIRHLDSGSCNACDWEMTTLTGPVYDIQRMGFDFVASPRHADVLMVTGPVTRNLEIAVHKTFAATPAPKIVLAVGTCACSGGICGKSYASSGGVNNIIPVDVFIPGCPPRPQALIQGLLKAVGRA
ncbi:NADH-quinone oxidoreductase subunit NuoB [Desulfosporosinus nitroreducens]|uniref:NADH-quinone oxidoreductase subunit NuoB n=1 Tax=Desulfosporosinus nitroreducens TaxID=2018668 RepID=A0ABT8QSA3_9FIRM|nr:NADH-quinone oxidoreductase subunit NuoB [Desulfosporosinus nitroreducens]MCO1601830.1 NADH-quinone oxidoreductase subunit NuoB [Desulfosporosinus nitroreducens]MDO0823384.1 NADH-quinone oxidoreductase subunit NuoB [Desulfosporosinus nitroreducens]